MEAGLAQGGGESGVTRGRAARAGIAALNLIAPGLGLLRVGEAHRAIAFLLASFALAALFTFGMDNLPITSYARALAGLAVVIALLAALYVVPIALTWRASRLRRPLPWWSRWYGLLLAAAIALGAGQFLRPAAHHFYKPFYAPAESTAPTIDKGDKFVVNMRERGQPPRGEIVVFQGPDSMRVSRAAAVAGDRIAMRGGVPVVNGAAATERPAGARGVYRL